jgi:hypothetical protein
MPNESIEARLQRAAQDLDTASIQYAHRRTQPTKAREPRRVGVRVALVSGVIGVAASLVVAVVLARPGSRPVVTKPEIAAPGLPTSFSEGDLVLTVPGTDIKAAPETLTFHNGTANALREAVLTIRSVTRVPIGGQGDTETALLIDRKRKDEVDSAAVVLIRGPRQSPVQVAASEAFSEAFDDLFVRNNELERATITAAKDGSGDRADIRTLVRDGSFLTATGSLRRVTYVSIQQSDTDKEVRFLPNTTSAVVAIGPGVHVGSVQARAGQIMRIETRRTDLSAVERTLSVSYTPAGTIASAPTNGSIPDSTPNSLPVAINKSSGKSANKAIDPPANVAATTGAADSVPNVVADGNPVVLASTRLPSSLTVNLPVGGRYELSVEDAQGTTTIEVTIE